MRLYGFVMYNLSGIQKGIQFGHSAVEYGRKFGDTDGGRFKDFADNHKTFIVLCGGGSNCILEKMVELDELGIPYATFVEPDLNDSISAVTFLVDEKDYADEDYYKINPIKQFLAAQRLASN